MRTDMNPHLRLHIINFVHGTRPDRTTASGTVHFYSVYKGEAIKITAEFFCKCVYVCTAAKCIIRQRGFLLHDISPKKCQSHLSVIIIQGGHGGFKTAKWILISTRLYNCQNSGGILTVILIQFFLLHAQFQYIWQKQTPGAAAAVDETCWTEKLWYFGAKKMLLANMWAPRVCRRCSRGRKVPYSSS